MAFCSSCGAQLEGDSRFCVKCGADQTAKAEGAPAAAPAAAPIPVGAQPPAPFGAYPPAAPPHMPFVAPGQVPMSVAMPPPAPAKKSGVAWLVALVAVAGGYYYYTHYMTPQTQPGQAPTTQTQPGNPGQQPGNPGQQPAGNPGQQPAGYPGQQPGNPGQQPGGYPGQQPGGQGTQNQAIIAAQRFTGNYNVVNGLIQVTQGQWTNGSTIALAAVRLQCVQLTATGQGLTQSNTTLTGPAQPGQVIVFPAFQIGAVAPGATRVNCQITAVETTN